MKKLMIGTCLLVCIASRTQAQGRGGRQGGPGGGGPTGPVCLNPTDVKSIQTTNHTGGVNGGGATSEVVIVGNPGVGQLLNPCPVGLGGDDPFAKYLFSPDVIMSHQQAINFTDAQRTTLRALMLDAQKNFVPAQFKMAGEMETLQSLMDGPQVDEGKVLGQVDRVLALEREVKREQITLMIRVKNLLTPQQQDMLTKLRAGE